MPQFFSENPTEDLVQSVKSVMTSLNGKYTGVHEMPLITLNDEIQRLDDIASIQKAIENFCAEKIMILGNLSNALGLLLQQIKNKKIDGNEVLEAVWIKTSPSRTP